MDLPRVIAFDGDDTLWHNETLFSMTQGRFRAPRSRWSGTKLNCVSQRISLRHGQASTYRPVACLDDRPRSTHR
jgi:hypothetical protein